MVVKFVYEVTEGVSDDFEPAQVLYTGTTTPYFCRTLRTLREFRHMVKPVCLSDNLWTPCGYAVERSRFYGDSPLLLIVDPQKLESELEYDGFYRVDALPFGSFLPYQISPDPHGKLREPDYDEVIRISHLLPERNKDEIAREVARFLKARP